METLLVGKQGSVVIARGKPTVIIGERINPTGRKRLAAELVAGNIGYVKREAVRQVEQGADVIDVNVGAAGVDEVALLPRAVEAVAEVVDVPISIDTANPVALEAALKVCPGRPLVNSVNGEDRSLDAILPLVARYKVPVIGLLMDEEGIPPTAERRLQVASKISARAESLGIAREDIIFDCLALTVGTSQDAALITLETIRRVASEFGSNVVLGSSNVSFGLPDRGVINSAFLTLAIAAGLTVTISNPEHMKQPILATDLVLGRDEWAMRYIAYFRSKPKSE